MNYVKEKLDTLTSYKLEFYEFLDFFQSIVSPNSTQITEMNDFIQKCSPENLMFTKQLWIGHIRGCWMPSPCGPAEILRQPPWSTFALNFSATLQSTGSPSKGTFLNFSDLLCFSIWPEIYSLFGSRVVQFIFDKCILVQTVEEDLYLCLSHPNSFLCKKIINAAQYPGNRKRFVVTAPEKNEFPSIQTVNYRRRKQKELQESHNLGEFITKNPYTSELNNQRVCSALDIQKESRKERKLKRKAELDVLVGKPNTKKIKPVSSENVIPVGATEKSISVSIQSDAMENSSVSGPSSSNPRWIIPSPEILRKIQSDRMIQSQANNAKPLSQPETKSDENFPTFISILNDKYFKDKLELVTKECHIIRSGAPLSKRLNGLKIPRMYMYMKPEGVKLKLIVHRISETAAKKYGLRINPRKRTKKATLTKELPLPGSNNEAQVIKPTNEITLNSNVSADSLNPGRHPANCSLNAAQSIISWSPFSPNIPLSTASICYNKLSESRAPSASKLGQILNNLTLDNVEKMGGKTLEYCILSYPVHQLPASADGTNPSIGEQVEELKQARKFIPLRKLLTKLPKFHTSVRNITKLVKTCGVKWILKEHQKVILKAQKKDSRILKRQHRMSVSETRPSSNTEESSPDLIDLTFETQSTPSTRLSQDHSVNLQNSKLATEKSGNDTSGLKEHSNSDRSRNRKSQAATSFNISNTPHPVSPENKTMRKQLIMSQKLKSRVSFSCVLSTISQILHLSGGGELLGSNYNRRGFMKFVRKSICLAGTHSALQLGQLMSMLNLNQCKWLERVSDPLMRTHIFAKVVAWLFKEYVLVIFKIGFYITETSRSRFQLEFYFRDTWKSLSDRVRHRFLNGGKLRRLSADAATVKRNSAQTITGALRLIPKANNDVRPILALRSTIVPKQEASKIKLILNYISFKLVKNGVKDATDLRNHWVKFLKEWQELKCPKLYYVRADIKDAYPSVNTDLLGTILKESIIGEDGLIVKEFLRIGASKPTVTKTIVNPGDANTCWHTSVLARPCIIQDNYTDSNFKVHRCMSRLLKTLTAHVVKIGLHKYDFSHGLAQGSPLSQALCNIYYGHLDKTHFSDFLQRKGEIFVRSVDDYLYISPNPYRVAQVFHKLRKGFPDYHCEINREKSLSNIFVPSNLPVTRSEWISYCGWRFCITNGHVSRDFTSYANQDSCSTLTFRLNNTAGPEAFIFRRLGMITPLRLKSLILDPVINCRERILITLFEASLMMAFRFYAACRVLYPSFTVLQDPAKGYQLFRCISRFATAMNRHIIRNRTNLYPYEPCHLCSSCAASNLRARLRGSPDTELQDQLLPKPDDFIQSDEVFFVVYHAFLLKLSKHPSAFQKTVLPKLRRLKRRVEQRIGSPYRDYLLNTLGTSLPEHFAAIKI